MKTALWLCILAGMLAAKAPANAGRRTVPDHTPDRLDRARRQEVPHQYTPPAIPADCELKPPKANYIQLSFEPMASSASRFNHSGLYCFVLTKANDVLYTWSFTLNVPPPVSTPFDLLNDAIQTVTNLATGAPSARSAEEKTREFTRPLACPVNLDDVTSKSSAFQQALSALDPPKDSSGKAQYVSIETTLNAWNNSDNKANSGVPTAFDNLEAAVQALRNSLQGDVSGCTPAVLAQAEALIVDDYPKLRRQFFVLQSHINSNHTVYYGGVAVDNTAPADLTVTASYNQQAAASGSKVYHFDRSFSILSSSAGFLISELPARSYSSATAPDPSDPAMTQNVLSVSGSGASISIPVLLNGNIPALNNHNYGIGLSAGPVFDISSGKADTSHFGFFGGLSIRLTPYIYLTPGVHVGEFADFPQGFSHAGQVIPANTGTPTPIKRYTARFGVSITFKLKDLYSATGKGQGNAPPSTQSPGGLKAGS